MALYISADGNWGDATDLLIVDDTEWTDEDLELMQLWTQSWVDRFASAVSNNPKLTPTQWETKQNES